MKVMVLGGTGQVGSQVVRELLSRGARVSVLTRSAEKAGALPSGVEAVVGDLLDPQLVRTVFRGHDAAFLVNTVSPTEGHEGLMAVNGAVMGGVRRVVYLSVHEADKALHLPHFGLKVAIENAVVAAGIPYTILRPNNFYQNDFWFREPLLQHGVYPQPLGGVGLSRVDVRDIAAAAAVALTEDGHDGQTYNLVGPEVHTGTSTAEEWGRALGREVTYAGDDLESWEQANLRYLPAPVVFDFKLMYAFFQENGLRASAEDVERQTRLIGHPPRRFADFAAETAAAWKQG